MNILVINNGSSSLKFAVYDLSQKDKVATGVFEGIGTDEGVFTITHQGNKSKQTFVSPTHLMAFDALKAFLDQVGLIEDQLAGIGHRVVHGGVDFKSSVLVDDEVISAIDKNSSLAPLHNPANLLAINESIRAWPSLPQVAVFDTSFHQTMPPHAFRYAIPDEYYQRDGIRRYGFHGTSHRFVSQKAADYLGQDLNSLNLITAHLGNGCSACAIKQGKSVDTTMGLTPLEGLVMGTRSGDLDPGIIHFLQDKYEMSAQEMNQLLNKQSGLKGLSGLSQDMRELIQARSEGHELAAVAIDVFTYKLAKSIASLAVPLGRLDALVFTGGIGENSEVIRNETVAHLQILNLTTGEGSGPKVLVINTDEELLIAQDTQTIIQGA